MATWIAQDVNGKRQFVRENVTVTVEETSKGATCAYVDLWVLELDGKRIDTIQPEAHIDARAYVARRRTRDGFEQAMLSRNLETAALAFEAAELQSVITERVGKVRMDRVFRKLRSDREGAIHSLQWVGGAALPTLRPTEWVACDMPEGGRVFMRDDVRVTYAVRSRPDRAIWAVRLAEWPTDFPRANEFDAHGFFEGESLVRLASPNLAEAEEVFAADASFQAKVSQAVEWLRAEAVRAKREADAAEEAQEVSEEWHERMGLSHGGMPVSRTTQHPGISWSLRDAYADTDDEHCCPMVVFSAYGQRHDGFVVDPPETWQELECAPPIEEWPAFRESLACARDHFRSIFRPIAQGLGGGVALDFVDAEQWLDERGL